jgi:hypothetical protein
VEDEQALCVFQIARPRGDQFVTPGPEARSLTEVRSQPAPDYPDGLVLSGPAWVDKRSVTGRESRRAQQQF